MNPLMSLESQSMDPLPSPSRFRDADCDMGMDIFWHVTHEQPFAQWIKFIQLVNLTSRRRIYLSWTTGQCCFNLWSKLWIIFQHMFCLVRFNHLTLDVIWRTGNDVEGLKVQKWQGLPFKIQRWWLWYGYGYFMACHPWAAIHSVN